MATEEHEHEHEEGTYGMALGFRTVESEGKLYLAEAEIAPYTDEPDELGVTLVFHPLEGLDPTGASEEMDWPAWPIDIDDDLSRDSTLAAPAQFQAIVRQLHSLTDQQLLEYMLAAREEAEGG